MLGFFSPLSFASVIMTSACSSDVLPWYQARAQASCLHHPSSSPDLKNLILSVFSFWALLYSRTVMIQFFPISSPVCLLPALLWSRGVMMTFLLICSVTSLLSLQRETCLVFCPELFVMDDPLYNELKEASDELKVSVRIVGVLLTVTFVFFILWVHFTLLNSVKHIFEDDHFRVDVCNFQWCTWKTKELTLKSRLHFSQQIFCTA